VDCFGIALAIFAVQPVHLYGEKFIFSITAWYIVHMFKLWCYYAYLGKFYNLNMWIASASHYSKVRAMFALSVALYISMGFLEFSIIQ